MSHSMWLWCGDVVPPVNCAVNVSRIVQCVSVCVRSWRPLWTIWWVYSTFRRRSVVVKSWSLMENFYMPTNSNVNPFLSQSTDVCETYSVQDGKGWCKEDIYHHHYFWHAPLVGACSTKLQTLSHVNCFIQGEVTGFQVLLDSLHPCSTRASQWSTPVLQWKAVKIVASVYERCWQK